MQSMACRQQLVASRSPQRVTNYDEPVRAEALQGVVLPAGPPPGPGVHAEVLDARPGQPRGRGELLAAERRPAPPRLVVLVLHVARAVRALPRRHGGGGAPVAEPPPRHGLISAAHTARGRAPPVSGASGPG